MGTGPRAKDLEREGVGRWILVGSSNAVRLARESIELLKDLPVTVVIVGRSGTGKEVVANLLHALSLRAKTGRFVAQNCGAFPKDTAESELMGHVEGAFTGAVRNHRGLIEQADGGTLFLDEFESLSPELQVKILRVLEERKVRRVGGEEDTGVDARFVIAVKRPLEELVREGHLREDLYFRIQKAVVTLPGLSERREDIPLLVAHFLEKFASQYGRAPFEVEPEAMAALESFDWPGNVRELETEIELAFIRKITGTLRRQDLSERIRERGTTTRRGRKPRDETRDQRRAEEALKQAGGSSKKARVLLGISKSAFYRWLRK